MAKDNTQIIATNSSGLTNGNLKKRTNNHNNINSSPLQTNSMNGKTKLSSMSIEDQFNAAVNVIQNLPKNGSFQPSDQLKLKFYAFFKQAKEGSNRTPKPSFYEIIARYKHDAWAKLGDMSKEDAMKNYVNELKQIIQTMPYNESNEEFYDSLGPFAELKKEQKSSEKVNGELNQQFKLNGKQLTKDANYSSSNDSSSDSDDFSDTVDSLSVNGDSKPNSNNLNENGFTIRDHNFDNNHCFEDCTDVNSKLQPGDVINAKGIDAGYLTGQENYFHDCIDNNSVLHPNDIICARGETGIFSSSRTNLPSSQEQSSSRTFRQPLGTDNSGFRSDGSFFNQGASGSGNGGDRNFSSIQHSELNDIHEHLALTVLRLQQTVKSISNRIENLETKVNERQIESSRRETKKENWWSSRTTQTTILLIIWPFAAHLIISAIKKKVNKQI